ncbi:hypothetical protein FHS16_005156 [Paenibacillus endophyticus]|uniref:Uncharacterized protein n=1 Tax=Paenibacillus endophyticus TaxID=1294268 RepID=A0A7W5GC66_9BACL|nr:hypothetical protein [Paenibacillus endophyticus]
MLVIAAELAKANTIMVAHRFNWVSSGDDHACHHAGQLDNRCVNKVILPIAVAAKWF